MLIKNTKAEIQNNVNSKNAVQSPLIYPIFKLCYYTQVYFWHHSQDWIQNTFGNLSHINYIINMCIRYRLDQENIQVLMVHVLIVSYCETEEKYLLEIYTD